MKTIIYNTEQLFSKTFGLQLTAAINSRRIPVQELALSCNVHYNQMTGYMRGEHMPTIEILVRICNCLNVHIDFFMPTIEHQPSFILSDYSHIEDDLDIALQRVSYCQYSLSSICDKGYLNHELSESIQDDLLLITNILWSFKKFYKKQYDISLKTFK